MKRTLADLHYDVEPELDEVAAETYLYRFSSPPPVQNPVLMVDSQSNPQVEDVERILHLLFLVLPLLSLVIPYRKSYKP
jgi:hypothetical protein